MNSSEGEPVRAGIQEQARDFREGRISASAQLRSALARLDAVEARLNAFVHVHRSEAEAEACTLDEAGGRPEAGAALAGLPVAIKDNIDEADRVCSVGSAAYAQRRPALDAAVVRALRGAGAVILGRTNMHELADGVTSDNPHFGAVRNPWGPERTPGGSSGGSAVSVAAGVVDLAFGTDTGGSVRIPASLCGIAGFKPSSGLLSTAGVVPLSTTLDHVGPLARTAKDLSWAMRVLAPGPEPDRWLQPAELCRLRVGVLEGFGLKPEPAVARAMDVFLVRLEQARCTMQPVRVPELELGLKTLAGIYFPEAYHVHAQRLAEAPDLFGEQVRQTLERGRRQVAEKTHQAFERRRLVTQALKDAMERAAVDLLVCPTTPAPARPFPVSEAHQYLIYTCPFNLSGQPALSLPMGLAEGWPVGLQLVARHGDDARLLAWACAMEDLSAPDGARPTIRAG